MMHHPAVTNKKQTNDIMIIIMVCLPFLAGEKKLKTGEKMVPRRVVLGGLVVSSTAVVSSRPPLDFSLLLSWLVASAEVKQFEKHLSSDPWKQSE